MGRAGKIFEAARRNPAGLTFFELQRLIEAAGFRLARTSGSHHGYTKPGVAEIINVQPAGRRAKTYQVRQVLVIIDEHGIEIE
ncbi:MAG TPA: type II toxin-antitoxin system HicA family toxin [Polyangia bacterium]|nr:type II toxin-antitoxin system HicA family toxin [Polyangia bacterium]